jgi:DNA-binding PucR family transcriptional regulator
MKRTSALLVMLLVGCSNKNAELEAKVAAQQDSIRMLEEKVAVLEKRQVEASNEPNPADIQRYARQVGLAQKDIERSIRQQQEEIASMRAKLEPKGTRVPVTVEAVQDDTQPATTPVQRKPTARDGFYTPVTVYAAPDPVREDFIDPPSDPKADLFPVLVSEVHSAKIVTGVHTTTQIVATDKKYEDDFGNMVAVRAAEEVELTEHDYEIRFAARNLTKTAKAITAGAGRDSRVITLQPGEVATNLAIAASFGADLTVRSRGDVRSFVVLYED